MKIQLAVLSVVLVTIATGCQQTGAFSGFGASGQSWQFKNPKISVVGNTLLISADEWTHVGTNGVSWPTAGTNTYVPAGQLFQVR